MDNPTNRYHERYHRIVNRWLIFSVIIISLIANFTNNGLVEGAWMVFLVVVGGAAGLLAALSLVIALYLLNPAYKELTYWLAGD